MNMPHDYARPHLSSPRTKLRLKRKRRAAHPMREDAHMRRVLRTEYNGGLAIGLIAGAFIASVTLALSLPWWAPVITWMIR